MTDLGFDEGGVLQALATPVIDHTVTRQKTLKSGRVVTETTTIQVTGAQIVAMLLGSSFLALFLKYKDMTDEEKAAMLRFIVFGPITGSWIGKYLGKDKPLATEEERATYAACQKKLGIYGPLTVEQMRSCGIDV